MTIDIENKTVLVTGANRGIGKIILETFLNYGATKVYAAVRNLDSAEPLVKANGDKVVPLHLDLDKPDTITAAAKQASDVDIVISNAGILKVESPLSDNAINALQQEININLFGLIRMAQAFAPVLKKNGGGAFVQLNSVASLKSFPDFATYSASKAAAYSITQALKDILKEQNTHVVSVHPGPIDTDMAKEAGIGDIAESPEVVATAIIHAIQNQEFHAFPDAFAKEVGKAYNAFAENIIEADLMEEA